MKLTYSGKKDKPLLSRFTAEEVEAIRKKAGNENRSICSYIRNVVLKSLLTDEEEAK